MNKFFTMISVFSALNFCGLSAETYQLCPIAAETDPVMLHRRALMIESHLHEIEESIAMIQFYLGNEPYDVDEDEG